MVLITPINVPEHGLIYGASNVQLKLGHKIVDIGTVYIAQDTLSWQPDNLPEGISVLWKQVSVHGIAMNPSKCIYFMLDHKVVWPGVYDGYALPPPPAAPPNGHNGARQEVDNEIDEGNETDEEDDEGAAGYDEESDMTECWLIPQDVNIIDAMFRAMTDCQAMHPDSAESISDESDFMDDLGGDDDYIPPLGLNRAVGGRDGDGNDAGAAVAAAAAESEAADSGMQNLSLNDDGRFEDADE